MHHIKIILNQTSATKSINHIVKLTRDWSLTYERGRAYEGVCVEPCECLGQMFGITNVTSVYKKERNIRGGIKKFVH